MPKGSSSTPDADPGGDFDLNATPRGFDLNAPLPEEEGGWMSAEEPKETIQDTKDNSNPRKRRRLAPALLLMEPATKLGIDEDLDILQSIWNAQHDPHHMDDLLAGLCEEIGKQPAAPPRYQYLSCIYISKKLPGVFTFPRTFKVMLSFLDPNGPGSSTKKQSVLPFFACKVMYRAFSEEAQWPLDFVKVYLEDAVNSRSWVDQENCQEFVGNVLTAFRDDDQDMFLGDDAQENSSKGDCSNNQATMVIKNRYPQDDVRQEAKAEFLGALKQAIRAPSAKENPRILIRFLTLGLYYEEVRNIASAMVETWLNNPIHFRGAKLLLDRLILLTNTTSVQDLDTVTNLLSLKLSPQVPGQTKSLYADIVVQIVQKRPEYSFHALKTFLTAELNQKVSQNVKGISAVLRALPDSQSPERELSAVIKELFLSEGHVSRLHDIVGRVTKQLSRDASPFLLSRALLEPWPQILQQEERVRRAWLSSIADLACKQLIQAASILTSDEALVTAISSPDVSSPNDSLRETFAQLEGFSLKVMTFQVEALTWCIDVLNAALPQMPPTEFAAFVRKLQFLEPAQEYSLSSTSSDAEVNSFQLVAYCMHGSEEILARIILMGISNQFPMLQLDALSIIENLVWRAAASKNHVFRTLFADNNQLPAAILKLSSLNLPTPDLQQQFVLTKMFWRSCLVILVIAVHNPSTIGRSVWENLMPLKCLMQCLITENMAFSQEDEAAPSTSMDQEIIDTMIANEGWSSESVAEMQGNVMLLTSANEITKVPKYVLDELGEINRSYHLGQKLRRCTDPNLLKETINSQESDQAWTWVREMVKCDPEAAGFLPSDWQCEVLYMHERSKVWSQATSMELKELRGNMYKLIEGDSASARDEVCGVITRLSAKLMSPSCAARSSARKCFSTFFKEADTSSGTEPSGVFTDCSWLDVIEKLQTVPAALDATVSALQTALIYESSTTVILSYLSFLRRHLSAALFCWTFARFMAQRKLVSSSLLRIPVVDMILEAYSNAIQSCSEKDWESLDIPLVGLVSAGVDLALPACVLEAIVHILVGTSSSSRNKASYCSLVKLLFPGFVDEGGDRTIALESGTKSPFLSREQASLLAGTDDIRLVKAGFSILGFNDKIQLLMKFRLSAEAKACLAEEMKDLPVESMKTLPSLTNRERLHLQSCLSLLVPGSTGTISRSDEPMDVASSSMDCSDPPDLETAQDPSTMVSSSEGGYLPCRRLLEKLALGTSINDVNGVVDALNCVLDSQDGPMSLVMVLPVMTLLVDAGETSASTVVEVILKNIRKLRHNGTELSAAASKLLRRLENRLLAKLGNATEDTMDVPEESQLEQSLRTHLCLRLATYLKQEEGKDGSVSSILQYAISKLKELGGGNCSGELSKIELAGRYGTVMSFISLVFLDNNEPEHRLVFTELLTVGMNATEFTLLVLELLLHHNKNKTALIVAQGIWDALADNLNVDLIQPLTDSSCLAAASMLEFLYLCRQGLRFANSSSHVLATLSVISCVKENEKRENIAIQLLLHAASTYGVMRFLIKQLKILSCRPQLRRSATKLLCSLYLACPVTVGSGLDLASESSTFLKNTPQKFGFLDILGRAIRAAFLDPRKNGPSAICLYFASKHPWLFIRHFSTLRLQLQEIWDNPERRATLIPFTVELLNAVRPWLATLDHNSMSEWYDELEALLVLLLKAIEDPDDTFIEKLASFLCHVVTAGGKLSLLLRAHKRAIQAASLKFTKTKVFANLMELLDKDRIPELSVQVERPMETSMQEVLEVLSCSEESREETWDIFGVRKEAERSTNLVLALEEFEQASANNPELLVDMESILLRMTAMDNVNAREKAYTLVARSLERSSGGPSQALVREILGQISFPGGTKQQLELITGHIRNLLLYFEEAQMDVLLALFRRSPNLNMIVTDAQLQ